MVLADDVSSSAGRKAPAASSSSSEGSGASYVVYPLSLRTGRNDAPPTLHVLATRNTADRTIATMDLAIRRRFAVVPMWPNLRAVETEGVALAGELFAETVHTFAEFADDETLRLVPGHA